MSPQYDSISTPHKCRYLRWERDPNVPISAWTQATCVRVEQQPREVTPALDCVGCRHWEPPDGT